MTACSSHPGTISGAALKELLDEADRAGDLMRTQISAAAKFYGLGYSSFSLLTRIAAGAVHHDEQHLGELRALGLVSDNERKPDLLPAGAKVLAGVNAELAGWLDGQATDQDPHQFRELTNNLRRIRQSIA